MQSFINRPIHKTSQLPDNGWPVLSMKTFLDEPSLSGCGVTQVQTNGGVLANTALTHILAEYAPYIQRAENEGLSPIIDANVQCLMPGMYPAVPGWHCDGVPRSDYHGQPCFDAVNPHAFHVAVTVSTEPVGISHMEFVADPITVKIWDDQHVYRDLHQQVDKAKPVVRPIPDGVFVLYSPKTIHRAAETYRRGWRMFFRFSMCRKPPITNKVNGQQQIYLLSPGNGW
jgi:hypothetical protein